MKKNKVSKKISQQSNKIRKKKQSKKTIHPSHRLPKNHIKNFGSTCIVFQNFLSSNELSSKNKTNSVEKIIFQ